MFTPQVFHRRQLPYTDVQLKSLVRRGSLLRVRPGWYATPAADADEVAARKIGGTMTGPTLLRKLAVWLRTDPALHVLVGPHASGIRAGHACVHYLELPATPRDQVATALWAMAMCCTLEETVAAVDSILELGLLRIEELEPYAARHFRLRQAIERASSGSQSGLETRFRLFLRANRIRYRIQVDISGVGRVDFLIGDRLVVEVDGRTHHLGGQFEQDRRRDLELIRQGYVVVRLSYRMLFDDWQRTQEMILELIRRGEHLGPLRGFGSAVS